MDNIKKKIYVNPYARSLINANEIIVGCFIGEGQWLKIPAVYYEFLLECVNNEMSVSDILSLCENNYEYEYYDDLLRKLFIIGVFTFEDNQSDITLKNVSLDLTSRCNLRCRHCATAYGDIPAFDMSFDTLTSIVQWCEDNHIKNLTLTGGEIFLLKDIDERLRYIRSNYSGVIEILTNGTMIDDEQITLLKENVDAINISLDGYDEKSTEKIRGKGVYEKVIRLIGKLQDAGFEQLSLSMVLTRENRDNLDKFNSLCSELGVRAIPRTLNPAGRARIYYNEFKNEELKIDKGLAQLSFRASCMAGHTTVSSFANGQVQPCAALDNDNYKMGNIQELINGTINKPELSDWCIVDKVSTCKDCNVRYFCASHCQAVNEAIYLDKELREERCKSRKRMLQEAVWS